MRRIPCLAKLAWNISQMLRGCNAMVIGLLSRELGRSQKKEFI